MEVFENWYREFLTDWDKRLKRCVITAIQNGHKDKMKKQLGVFNFSNETLAEEANEILKLGKKAVPPVEKGETSAMKTFEAELYQYLVKYRRQIERRPGIKLTEEDESVCKWLETAIEDDEEKSSEHFEFYTGLYQNLNQAYKNIEREAYSFGMNMTATKLHKILNIKEHIWNEADKNLGFILLPCSKMVEAEKEMRIKLGAEMEARSSDEIIEAVDEEAGRDSGSCVVGGDSSLLREEGQGYHCQVPGGCQGSIVLEEGRTAEVADPPHVALCKVAARLRLL